MGWKNWSYWLRGLLSGSLIGIIAIVYSYIIYLKCQESPLAYGDALRCLGPGLGFAISIWAGLGVAVLGLIMGWIFGKMKKK